MKKIMLLSALLAVMLGGSRVVAQLNVVQMGLTQLVDQGLLGGGIIVSNITHTGSSNSIGYFYTSTNPTNLGITNGIIMSSGLTNGSPAIGSPVSGFASTQNNTAGDAQLQGLATSTVYDASVLQFDFLPVADTLTFRYVFGSEEYPEYVGSNYNDVFGFFISGPNPLGGNYVNKNLAIIPGTSLPVAINNVNAGTNSAYYVNNQGMNGQTIVYDGFTTVLTAWCRVQPCVQYHIKLAVGDVHDGVYDSGVFLEAGSFKTNVVTIHTSFSLSGAGNYGIEGCNDAYITFKLPYPLATPSVFPFTISGSATNGVDYTAIPDSVVVPAGQDSVVLVIHPIADGITEGMENLRLDVQTSPCGAPEIVELLILDQQNVTVTTSNDTTVCQGQLVNLWVHATGNFAPYSYIWSNGISASTIHINPVNSSVYHITVHDTYGCSSYDSVSVSVFPVPPVTASAGSDTICLGTSTTITAAGASTYNWSSGLGAGNSKVVSPASNTTYTVTGTASTGCTATASVTVIVRHPAITVVSVPDTICSGQYATLTAGGVSTYQWSHSLGGGNNIAVAPASTTTYTVTGTDIKGCTAEKTVTVNVIPSVAASVSISCVPSGIICMGTNVVFTALAANGGTPAYQWKINGSPVPGATGSVYSSSSLSNGDAVSCVMTSTAVCATNNPAASNIITISVSSPANATINPAGPFCDDDPALNLTAASPGGVWDGTGITDSLAGTFDPSAAGVGTHEIIYTISGVCTSSDTIHITVTSCTGTFEVSGNMKLYCYPNPTQDIITFTFDETFQFETLRIYNIFGQKTEEKALTSSSITIDLQQYSDGMYFALFSGKESVVIRVMKK